MNDLKLVFRQPEDQGLSRKKDTPDPVVILTNLKGFTKKWNLCGIDGWRMLNEKVHKEISSLEVHIKKGCLSGIPAGAGTNRNERLHRHLKPHFSCTRLGLPMALALTTILLHQYNGEISEKKLGIPPVPITYESNCDNSYHFGITRKDANNILPNTDTTKKRQSFSLHGSKFF
jgi:hypothetical protein